MTKDEVLEDLRRSDCNLRAFEEVQRLYAAYESLRAMQCRVEGLPSRWKELAPLLIPQQTAIYEQCADELRAALKGE